MNIVLVGLMGCGKSTVGRILAETLGRPFVDTDAEIALAAGMPIAAIFAREGEAGFRAREQTAIAVAAAADGQVIATGGGAVLAEANRTALRRSGVLFWLDASPAELYRRAVAAGLSSRPLLMQADPLQTLSALAASRREAYEAAAHHRIETGGLNPQAVAAQIRTLLTK